MLRELEEFYKNGQPTLKLEKDENGKRGWVVVNRKSFPVKPTVLNVDFNENSQSTPNKNGEKSIEEPGSADSNKGQFFSNIYNSLRNIFKRD
mmetsp:Transcript_2940/g.2526  ORF Transcript_2940/g.2526 Transcript_2940/m.2526 type:complete len:92 (+) Transcript_2940:1655-1930(+)